MRPCLSGFLLSLTHRGQIPLHGLVGLLEFVNRAEFNPFRSGVSYGGMPGGHVVSVAPFEDLFMVDILD